MSGLRDFFSPLCHSLLTSCATMSGSSHQGVPQFPCIENDNINLLSSSHKSALVALSLALSPQSCTGGPENLLSLFVTPLGSSTVRMGLNNAGAPAQGCSCSSCRKPDRSKSVTGRGEGCMREGHCCFCPRMGEERRWKIYLVAPNSWKLSSVQYITWEQ